MPSLLCFQSRVSQTENVRQPELELLRFRGGHRAERGARPSCWRCRLERRAQQGECFLSISPKRYKCANLVAHVTCRVYSDLGVFRVFHILYVANDGAQISTTRSTFRRDVGNRLGNATANDPTCIYFVFILSLYIVITSILISNIGCAS